MPIYEQSYRRYEASEPLRQVRFWPITREALRLVLAKRAFLGLLALSFLPFIGRVVQIYVVTRFPEAGRVLPVDGRLFGEFLNLDRNRPFFLRVLGVLERPIDSAHEPLGADHLGHDKPTPARALDEAPKGRVRHPRPGREGERWGEVDVADLHMGSGRES